MSDRRQHFLVSAAAAIAIAASSGSAAVHAAEVSNSRGSSVAAQAVWGSGDPETGIGDWGGIGVIVQDGDAQLFLWEEETVLVSCGGDTTDPADDYEGRSSTFRSGYGAATDVSIDRSLRRAVASGAMTVESGTYDACTQVWTLTGVEPGVAVELDLVATGQPDVWSDRYVEHIPAEYRFQQQFRHFGYAADGTVTLGGDAVPFEHAMISRFSWNGHERY